MYIIRMCIYYTTTTTTHTHTHTTASLSRRPFNPRTAAVVDHPPRQSYYSYVLLYTIDIQLYAPLAKKT